MRTIAILAARPPEEGKTRLASALPEGDRYRLNINMFRHVLNISSEMFAATDMLVVTRSADLRSIAAEHGVESVVESGAELNAAFAQARSVAVELGADRLVTLSSDLPYLEIGDIEALLATPGDVVIAPDRHGTGTNALMLSPPDAIDFFYGPDSCQRHIDAAISRGRTLNLLKRPGLASDVDLPVELAELLARPARANLA
ncbi:2-phospho-L-lactate guanylyltransferase [Rhizorhabdus phycosphaerae]|uniref:2-phospho-L-lactate guanylyltransferase n=1 Tax=Rhizorhabdus phycosphaerae TaxID=2711156 RepID=UPI0013ECFA2D|nr:2-phospho-L-lactate guanylyltransferase [Rhizorhabdus phycosphaerae]